MAHFVEHMVFMGSEKYPDENDFDAFVSKHGGSTNACTDMEDTTFNFDIQRKHLRPALDRFAQFFTGTARIESCAGRFHSECTASRVGPIIAAASKGLCLRDHIRLFIFRMDVFFFTYLCCN